VTHASTRGGLTRRRVLAGAAWTTPIIVSSAVVPAYAASYDDTRPDYGIFTQAFVTHQELDTNSFLGLDSFSGPVENEHASVPAGSSGLYSAGGGKFTPGGSIGKAKWGGAGFWFSAPKATTKDGKQTYYPAPPTPPCPGADTSPAASGTTTPPSESQLPSTPPDALSAPGFQPNSASVQAPGGYA